MQILLKILFLFSTETSDDINVERSVDVIIPKRLYEKSFLEGVICEEFKKVYDKHYRVYVCHRVYVCRICRMWKFRNPDGIHYKPEGYELLSELVAEKILLQLNLEE